MRLIVLSDDFYQRHEHHREILQKRTRPYVCLEVTINGTTFAIPFRHHIKHRYAFITYGESGIDYTKAVVIASDDDVANRTPQIEQREYNALVGRDALIHNGCLLYTSPRCGVQLQRQICGSHGDTGLPQGRILMIYFSALRRNNGAYQVGLRCRCVRTRSTVYFHSSFIVSNFSGGNVSISLSLIHI